jgi:biotin synthase
MKITRKKLITQEIVNIKHFTKKDILNLLTTKKNDEQKRIELSYEVLSHKNSEAIHSTEKIIKISNYCCANCSFCRYKCGNKTIKRFRLNREEIINEVLKLYNSGCKSVMLHSGYDTFYNSDRIAYIIYSIKNRSDIKITLSLGLRELSEYKSWKIAGADSYLLNFVSSNKKIYEETNSLGSFNQRILHITELKKLGFTVGSGSILGLPNQTVEDIAEDILYLKQLPIDYVNYCNHFQKLIENIMEVKLNDNIIERAIHVTQIVYPDLCVRVSNLT